MVPPSVFDERFDSPCGLFDGGVFADFRRRFVGVFGAFGLFSINGKTLRTLHMIISL